ncbi:protealysin propeptide domain-containing protein [Xenorhabdus hominickii]|uniref:Peptidase M4 n=1 Tax=Xenorhabdus hominickii TaxID=351679 RepID=A0A2G0Q6V9_XENHO|nr:protealysin propeptide domain-containing protein [Xenorhabdus hominickii]AOM39321.1 hypothetical protein A9255_01015 [Xenorhabdus hominickii]PHM54936.1 peptidase M4 [Xenorhabdus hominickii]
MQDSETRKHNIIPPYLLEHIAKGCDENDKACILRTLEHVNKLMKDSVKEDALNPKDINSINKNKGN